jgi:hypothetical protein
LHYICCGMFNFFIKNARINTLFRINNAFVILPRFPLKISPSGWTMTIFA